MLSGAHWSLLVIAVPVAGSQPPPIPTPTTTTTLSRRTVYTLGYCSLWIFNTRVTVYMCICCAAAGSGEREAASFTVI